ncbi:DUF72 domain-containing protein [Actinoplanes sp. NPDC049265]|uniref:DUF72 domain-containing protein n=1 Tax=Actinoplanes sp. NPDC049265 TaxID=3363902 RepID=UPI00371E5EF6
MRLHVGCAQWTHKAWQGRIMPDGDKLRSYASWCNAVEGNTTFYATPARATVTTWAEQTEADFRFVVKLPRTITHDRRLQHAEGELRAFLHAIEPLGSRLHALWIQLPGSFAPGDLPALDRFLRGLPAGQRYAVEVRDPAFFTDSAPLEETLGRAGAEWVPFDTTEFFRTPPTSAAERDAWAKKPRTPLRTRALTAAPIVRYLGRDDQARTVEGWRRWVDAAVAWLREGRSPTIFIHTPDNADAPALARRFHAEVRARVPELAALPDAEPMDQPLTLF